MVFYLFLIIWLFLDLISKYFATFYLENTINLIWDFLYLQFITNSGIAFWIEINSFLLKIITIILIILIFYYYIKQEKNKNNILIDISFWLILAWAIWNGIQRVFNWFVGDFIWIKYFFIFNFADSFISIWAILYLYIIFKNKKELCHLRHKK